MSLISYSTNHNKSTTSYLNRYKLSIFNKKWFRSTVQYRELNELFILLSIDSERNQHANNIETTQEI